MATLGRILVTGASGFVGKHLIPALHAAFPDAQIYTTSFDVTDAEVVARAIQTFRPDACVHLAGVAAILEAQHYPDRAWRVNLFGTLNVAHALLKYAPSCRFLYVSSADVYGSSFRFNQAVEETVTLAPMNTYAATKAAADLAVGALAENGLAAIRVRPFNHTGPGQSPDFVVAAFAAQVARIAAGQQKPVLSVGALDRLRDFLDVRDVCAAYVACLQHAEQLPPGIILNIASGTPRRIGDILDALLEAAGIRAQIESDVTRLRSAEILQARGDSSQAYEKLGWRPKIRWEQTLHDVLNDWRGRVAAEVTP